eukprot:12765228-Heterocapsa_arctica.AAC.1
MPLAILVYSVFCYVSVGLQQGLSGGYPPGLGPGPGAPARSRRTPRAPPRASKIPCSTITITNSGPDPRTAPSVPRNPTW